MRVFTLWHRGDDEDLPWIIDAVDELTVSNNNEFPPNYVEKRDNAHVRELILQVPDDAIRALFESPGVVVKVVK